MARATLSLKFGSHSGADNAKRFFSQAPRDLDDAAYKATFDSTLLLGEMAEDAIEDIAGGVYWDVIRTIQPTNGGGRGVVRTPPSRPHTITPNPPRKALRFVIDGEEIFAARVDHPGSNPVDWPDRLGGFTAKSERIFANHVGRVLGGFGGA